ncbi:MAG: endolytic transglycosylase MltG [Deltaproteobacteria bacterium]|nr:endolytic transglycosylase MltG [Deltaproteobacteria bacterium]
MTISRGIIAGTLLLVISAAVVAVTYKLVHFWMRPASSLPSRAVFYEVRKNESPQAIARDLERSGIVSNASLFYWYGRFTGKNQKIRAGDYRFTTAMRPDEVLTVLMSGISYGIPFTVPEGYNLDQIVSIIESIRPGSGTRFERLCRDPAFISSVGISAPNKNLEGYLFPETYLIGRRMPEEEIIRQMVRRTLSLFTPELMERARQLGFNAHQIVTLASIIEKETGAPEERAMISSVFHNRLRRKMKLQSDPTAIYGKKDFDGNLRKADLRAASPYNTYVIPGLPIGPIANPGKDAILAALYPNPTPYLYFVSHNDGTHEFTSTYEEHMKAVSKFQLDRRAREGKSWRDLRKAAGSGNQ